MRKVKRILSMFLAIALTLTMFSAVSMPTVEAKTKTKTYNITMYVGEKVKLGSVGSKPKTSNKKVAAVKMKGKLEPVTDIVSDYKWYERYVVGYRMTDDVILTAKKAGKANITYTTSPEYNNKKHKYTKGKKIKIKITVKKKLSSKDVKFNVSRDGSYFRIEPKYAKNITDSRSIDSLDYKYVIKADGKTICSKKSNISCRYRRNRNDSSKRDFDAGHEYIYFSLSDYGFACYNVYRVTVTKKQKSYIDDSAWRGEQKEVTYDVYEIAYAKIGTSVEKGQTNSFNDPIRLINDKGVTVWDGGELPHEGDYNTPNGSIETHTCDCCGDGSEGSKLKYRIYGADDTEYELKTGDIVKIPTELPASKIKITVEPVRLKVYSGCKIPKMDKYGTEEGKYNYTLKFK
ncbi:MAG: hypothetical protein K6E64_06940 [Lachnospiraceae bacterium]|nr:hypothetical protein [Lachnospiraceae bacterium]